MQLLGLSAMLLLISAAYGQDNTTALVVEVVANPLSSSAIIAFPSGCQYSSKAVTLYVNTSNQTTPQIFSFTTPQCRLKRDIIVINSSQSGNVETVNVGYQIPGLSAGTSYKAYYMINGQQFKEVAFITKSGLTDIPPVVFARSGGMVVITVILSTAMFLLIVGLIVALVLGGKGK
ncbi:PREDICTED: uroplakin-2 [Nanorana parkeri]|uniref:uroplakin-2 n=1 Tax=Nanorana parkeri TaxID=125878 RepID=UPI00085403E8|nr:PREDICTED: uroplakin-2 [Nanorana parkeri]